MVNLNPADAIVALGDSLSRPFAEIFDFLFFNIFTPIVVVLFTILFFFGQYWLLKFYYFAGRAIVSGVLRLYSTVVQSKQFRDFVTNAEEVLERV